MDLREWMVLYVRHKDMMARRLTTVKEEDGRIVFMFKEGPLYGYPMERLTFPKLEGRSLLVTPHTGENVGILLKRWEEFAAAPEVTVVFVNIALNEKWLITPHTHHMVAETNLEQGVRAIADGVPYVA